MRLTRTGAHFALALAALMTAGPAARADKIDNQVAVFAALDKVTARISKLEVKLNETVKFGSLAITPRTCSTRPPEESPKTTSFVEIDDVQLDGSAKRLFTGWMFAESPGLNAVEHPVFDVWLTDCSGPTRAATSETPRPRPASAAPRTPAGATGATGATGAGPAPGGAASAQPDPGAAPADEPLPRRRFRR